MILLELYVQFFIIGATAFGGGYAVLPLINSFIVEGKGWLTVSEMTDLVSISNMTPGPIAINSATFVGTKVAGIKGAIAATAGVVSPSFILMMILGYFLFSSSKKMSFLDKMLKTLRPAVVGLIAIAALNMTKNSVFKGEISLGFDKVAFITFVAGLILYYKKTDLIKLIALGALAGIVLTLFIS